jgi:hypothetical protein
MLLVMRHFPAGAEGQAYWVHLDGRGSVAGITQHLGQSTHHYRYDAYGQLLPAQGNWTDPHNHYTFAGKEWDEHLGLYGCRGRKPGFPGSGDSGLRRSRCGILVDSAWGASMGGGVKPWIRDQDGQRSSCFASGGSRLCPSCGCNSAVLLARHSIDWAMDLEASVCADALACIGLGFPVG